MILDIHNLTRHVADVEIARPRALLSWLFGWGKERNEPPWFAALKCWSEIGDIVAESEGWGTPPTSHINSHKLTIHFIMVSSRWDKTNHYRAYAPHPPTSGFARPSV